MNPHFVSSLTVVESHIHKMWRKVEYTPQTLLFCFYCLNFWVHFIVILEKAPEAAVESDNCPNNHWTLHYGMPKYSTADNIWTQTN